MIAASDTAEIVVACIGAVGVIVTAILAYIGTQLRSENREQHDVTASKLDSLAGKVDLLHDDLRDHITDHPRGR